MRTSEHDGWIHSTSEPNFLTSKASRKLNASMAAQALRTQTPLYTPYVCRRCILRIASPQSARRWIHHDIAKPRASKHAAVRGQSRALHSQDDAANLKSRTSKGKKDAPAEYNVEEGARIQSIVDVLEERGFINQIAG
jgi:hypothetical protein